MRRVSLRMLVLSSFFFPSVEELIQLSQMCSIAVLKIHLPIPLLLFARQEG